MEALTAQLDFATLADHHPELAELAERVSKATPPTDWRFFRHRAALRAKLTAIIPSSDFDAYQTAWSNLYQLWEQ